MKWIGGVPSAYTFSLPNRMPPIKQKTRLKMSILIFINVLLFRKMWKVCVLLTIIHSVPLGDPLQMSILSFINVLLFRKIWKMRVLLTIIHSVSLGDPLQRVFKRKLYRSILQSSSSDLDRIILSSTSIWWLLFQSHLLV